MKADEGLAGVTSVGGVFFVPDGDIPTTAIVEGVLCSSCIGLDVVRRHPGQLAFVDVTSRPVVFSRVCSPLIDWLPRWMAATGARYAYFLDDNLWEYLADNEVSRYYARPEVRASLDAFVGHAAVVLGSSRHLAKVVSARFPGRPVAGVNAAPG